MDSQHKKIIHIINTLIDQHNQGNSAEALSETLSKMTEYSLEHLSDEEKLLEEKGFPLYDEHVQLHEDFKLKILELCTIPGSRSQQVTPELLQYLFDWWSKHILQEDKKYSEYLKSKASD